MTINLDQYTNTLSVTDTATNADLNVTTKGTGNHVFNSGNGTQFRIVNANSSVNYFQTNGAATGGQPGFRVDGSDTNISTAFTTKGTGSHFFLTNGFSQTQFVVSHTASAVNYVQVTGSVTGGLPAISAQGSDSNVSLLLKSKGTANTVIQNESATFFQNLSGASQFRAASTASAVNYLSATGSIASSSPVLSALGSDTNIDLNLTAKGTGSVNLNNGNGIQFKVADTLGSVATANYVKVQGRASGGPPFITVDGTDTNTSLGISCKGAAFLQFYTNSTALEQFRISHTASAVNYLQVTGASTGNSPTISAQGSDAGINFILATKGSGDFVVSANSGYQFVVGGAASVVNYVRVAGGATGTAPIIQTLGSDTNIPLVLQPKGTGALQAQQTDSTATGGNARGSYATDLQKNRSNANQVADGTACVITGGINNRSSGNYNFVGGGQSNSAVYSNGVIVGGIGNTLQANSAFIGGGVTNTIVFGTGTSWSFIGAGDSNSANGVHNIVVGGFTNSATSATAVTTQSATMNGTTAVTLSGSNASIKVGQAIYGTSISDNTYVSAISGTSLTLSKVASGSSTSTLSFFTPHGVVVGGGNNTATGSYSFIGGGGDAGTAGNRNVASGDWSVVVGGQKNTASAAYSFIGGGGGNTASGIGSVVCGGGSFGSSPASFVPNTASGISSFVGSGLSNLANSNYGFIGAGVYGTTRGIQGNHIFPACDNPTGSFVTGASQVGLLVLGAQTTDATATVLRSTTSAASTTNQVILPNNSAYFFTGEVVAGVTGGGNTKGWTIEGVIKRGANAASTALVGTPTVTSTYADAGASTWVIALSADTTNGGLAVTFTGQAATTIRTVAQIRTTEMTY